MQLERIFQHYAHYYPTHEYPFDIFKACIISLKVIWRSLCLKIKNITLSALKNKRIEEEEYLLITEAEIVKDLIFEFVYNKKDSLKLPKPLKIS